MSFFSHLFQFSSAITSVVVSGGPHFSADCISFQVNGSITMIPGLYTDWLPPNMMASYIKEWLELGNVFRQFLNLTVVDPSPTCANLQNSLAELKSEYSQAVLSHSLSLQFSKSLSFLLHWVS